MDTLPEVLRVVILKSSLLDGSCLGVALFPGSLLALTKNRKGGGEPGTNLHVISRHEYVTAIITKVVMQLCSHVIG